MKNKRKKLIACVLAAVLGLSVTVSPVHAENNAGSFNVTGGTSGTEWTYDSSANTLTFNTSGTYTVEGDGQESEETIHVARDFEGTITIRNINTTWMNVENTAKLTLMLDGTNTLREGGLRFTNATTGSLTIDSNTDGSLTATSMGAPAGIGGISGAGNSITINGGTVTATSTRGAGIGGAHGGTGDNITINGGTVTATSDWGAGIGGGQYAGAGYITINGGKVIATGSGGAGIGGGVRNDGNNITINGGTVTAISEDEGAGIGGGINGNASNIIIDGGSVKASSIGVTPTDKAGKAVYLLRLENQSGVDKVTVDDKTFKRQGDHPDGDGTFYLYLTGQDHAITAPIGGYNAEWNGSNGFDISSSPTPAVTVESATASTVTVKALDNQDVYGTAEYSLDNQNWQSSNEFTELDADTEYTVYARYKGNDTYGQSKAGSVTVKTMKDGNALVEDSRPDSLTGIYGQKLSDISLPQGWTWADNDTALPAGEQSYPARFDTTAYEDEYDFTGASGYDSKNHYVESNLTVDVSKADSTVTINTASLDKEYDGNAVSDPYVEKTGSTKDVTFTWYQKDGDEWKELASAPADAGSYKVVACVEADDNYNGISAELEFVISKAVPQYEVPADLTVEQGQALSTVKLPAGFAWKDSTQKADKLGKQTFKAVYTPEDTENYQTVEMDITVDVVAKAVSADDTDKAQQAEAKTGDSMNVFVWTALLAVSLAAAVSSVLFRRRKQR